MARWIVQNVPSWCLVRVSSRADAQSLSTMLAQLDDVGEERQQRLDLSGQNIPALLWLVVLLASAVTLGFCLLLGVSSARLHYLMVAGVAMLIGASLVLILLLEDPFSGSVAVRPTPFTHITLDLGPAPRPQAR